MTLWTALSCRPGGSAQRPRAALALAGVALLAGCASTGSGGGPQATLAGSETSPPAAGPDAGPQITPDPTGGPTPVGGGPWDDEASAACEASVGDGFVQVAQLADDSAVTSFWSRGKQWVLCDVLLGPGSAEPPSLTTHASGRRGGFDESRLTLSTTVQGDLTDPESVRFSAGGPLPWPVQEISYTFPDGHTQQARFVESEDGSGTTWWAVGYTVTDGPLADPATKTADLGPVTISVVGPAAEAFRLPWEAAQRTE